jgi:hypothetical protein
MFAVLEGFSLDRDASNFTSILDADLQKMITNWSTNPAGSPNCVFFK